MTMFMVLSSWRGHCESSSGSFDECRLSARWPLALRPSQVTWPVSLLVGCYHPHPPSPFITAHSELRKVLFLAPLICGFFVCVWHVSGELLNGFVQNLHRRCFWSLAWTSLKVKVTRDKSGIFLPFGSLRAVYVWWNIFSLITQPKSWCSFYRLTEGGRLGRPRHAMVSHGKKNCATYPRCSVELLYGPELVSYSVMFQSSFSVLSFVPVLWPEFSRWHLYAGILHYQMNAPAVQVSTVLWFFFGFFATCFF